MLEVTYCINGMTLQKIYNFPRILKSFQHCNSILNQIPSKQRVFEKKYIRNLHENPKKRILNEQIIIRYLREYNTNLIQCHNYASVGSTSAIFRCQSNEQSCQLHLATQLSTARTLNFTVKGKSYARRLLYTCSRSFLFKLYSYRNLIKIYSCANLFLVTCTIDCGNAKTFQYICTVDYVRK